MKHGFGAAAALVMLALAPAAMAQPSAMQPGAIQCPLTRVTRTVTDSLPPGWWTTPIVSTLTQTKVQTIGGRPALMCVYGPAGSIQRDAPDGQSCTANASGFTCSGNHGAKVKPKPMKPERDHRVDVNAAAKPVASAVLNGSLSVPQSYAFDIDQGVIGSSANADLWFEAATAEALYLTPRNGARLWVGDRSNRGQSACAAGAFTSARVALRDLPVGSHVCVKTNEGRIGQIRVNALSGSPKTMSVSFTTWSRP